MKWPKKLFRLDGSQPHESWGGWKKFLESCEIRDKARGVTFFGKTNCNYILFPNGMIVENFGFHGKALMNRIREKGVVAVKKKIIAQRQEILDAIAKLKAM